MKKTVLGIILMGVLAFGAEQTPKDLDTYLRGFDINEKNDMKVKAVEMLNMVEEGTAVVIDIRFKEEFEVWNLPFTKNIPLNELPDRLGELPRDKLIITACPHNDRSNIARIYLTMKGYKAKYLSDGMLKAVDYLRGENAIEFMEELHKNNTKGGN